MHSSRNLWKSLQRRYNKNLHRRISDLISAAVAVLARAADKRKQVNAVSGKYSRKSRGILYFVVSDYLKTMSYIGTAHKQGHNAYDAIRRTFSECPEFIFA